MLSPHALYPLVLSWLQALEVCGHPTALTALAHLVVALLCGQSLRPSALMRALLSPQPVPARQRYKRVARFWEREWLTPTWLTPRLVRAALALVDPDGWGPTAGLTHVVLDSVRCGPWEVFTLGVVWHGRVLPVSWAALPYPWPKGQVTPTVGRLLRQVGAVWPPGRPAHLLADRAFPGQKLFRTLRQLEWAWTVRLRADAGHGRRGGPDGARPAAAGAPARLDGVAGRLRPRAQGAPRHAGGGPGPGGAASAPVHGGQRTSARRAARARVRSARPSGCASSATAMPA